MTFGVDFGAGGMVQFNGGAPEFVVADDLWWAGNFNNKRENMLIKYKYKASSKPHTITVTGLECCCDGKFGIDYEFHESIADKCIDVDVRIRDHLAQHPDFETISRSPGGKVQNKLDNDGKPVYRNSYKSKEWF